ncbi:hypothetical protein VMCG_07958 [Cytospora schulzeri]|uniref:Oxidoreductase n=1 Tax=Cytospora schulzeri TaxID=448051 RepID=A0A423VY88_9PEZI|nr:hypothetical protein VMCG_07958 [Valsa malicola]
MATEKTILITGCSENGIGAALAQALALAPAGYTVFATARNPSKIPSTLTSLANVKVLTLDVTSASSVADAVKAVEVGGGGRLDVLVNNSGVGYTIPLLDVDVDKAKEVYDINLWGVVRMVQAFAGLLIKSKGRVVNVSSVGAVVNTPWIGVYSSSKAALNQFSDTLRLELSPFGVSVVTIMVGTVTTPFHANEPDVELPPSSYYSVIRETIQQWAKGEAGPNKRGSAEDLAAELVDDIVGNASGQVWKGANSVAIKIVSRWVPAWILDGMMSTGQGIHELAKSLGRP